MASSISRRRSRTRDGKRAGRAGLRRGDGPPKVVVDDEIIDLTVRNDRMHAAGEEIVRQSNRAVIVDFDVVYRRILRI